MLFRVPLAATHGEGQLVQIVHRVIDRVALCEHYGMAAVGLEAVPAISAEGPTDACVGIAYPARGELLTRGKTEPSSLMEMAGGMGRYGTGARR